jgi:hypothetical protein
LGTWGLLQQLGRVPRRLVWDKESGIGRGKRHAEGVDAFAGTLATTLQRLKPHDPESKDVVERRNGFFETSFMPGRDFASPADFDAKFTDWAEHRGRPDRAHHQDPGQPTGSTPTGPRCCPCHRSHRQSDGSTASG